MTGRWGCWLGRNGALLLLFMPLKVQLTLDRLAHVRMTKQQQQQTSGETSSTWNHEIHKEIKAPEKAKKIHERETREDTKNGERTMKVTAIQQQQQRRVDKHRNDANVRANRTGGHERKENKQEGGKNGQVSYIARIKHKRWLICQLTW